MPVTVNNSFQVSDKVNSMESVERIAKKDIGSGYIKLDIGVSEDELKNIRQYVKDNNNYSFSCMKGACKPLFKNINVSSPPLIEQLPNAHIT